MANTIPSGSWIHTMGPGFTPKERRSSSTESQHEFYTIDDFIYTIGGGDGGGSAGILASLIDVTNTDGAFTHLPSQINAGTNIETLLRDILNPYNPTTVMLHSLGWEVFSGSSWGSLSLYAHTIDWYYEYGQKVKISNAVYTVNDPSVVLDNSGIFKQDGSTVGSNTSISDSAAAYTLNSVLELDSTSGGALPPSGLTYTYTLSFTDNGGTGSVTINSNTVTVGFRDRIRAGASTHSSATTTNLFSSLTAYNQLGVKGDWGFDANSDNDDATKYTWIAYPYSWGTATDIQMGEDGGLTVISDFEAPEIVSITDSNSQGASVQYIFYRSTSKGAFDTGQKLTIKF